MTTNKLAITKTAPIPRDIERVERCNYFFSQSTPPEDIFDKTAPANMDANQPEIVVITGFRVFLGHDQKQLA